MNVLSLFSGIGGLDLGLERAGMTIAGQVEIDPWCRKVLAKHWPEVPRHDDVRTCVQWWGGRAADLVCGGFPCQPFSSAGHRQGVNDHRWLWPAMADTVRTLRPRFVLVENVAGFLVAGMGSVLRDLATCGYDAEWDCIPAAAVGAPHRRDRVWLVAYPQGFGREPQFTGSADRSEFGQARAHAEGFSKRAGPGTSGRTGGRDSAPGVQELARSTASGPQILADPNSPAGPPPRSAGQTIFRPGTIQRSRRCDSGGWGFWATEPSVGRVAHGIPARMDRLRGLGNAVIPQVAEHIGRLIMEAAS